MAGVIRKEEPMKIVTPPIVTDHPQSGWLEESP
jgi:hypothetical protein